MAGVPSHILMQLHLLLSNPPSKINIHVIHFSW